MLDGELVFDALTRVVELHPRIRGASIDLLSCLACDLVGCLWPWHQGYATVREAMLRRVSAIEDGGSPELAMFKDVVLTAAAEGEEALGKRFQFIAAIAQEPQHGTGPVWRRTGA